MGGNALRGIHSAVDEIRRNVFTEVARLAYEGGDYSRIDLIPYKIVPGEVASYRHEYLHGAGHRQRAAAPGLRPAPAARASVHAPASDGIEESRPRRR